jgi:hypothetical protein
LTLETTSAGADPATQITLSEFTSLRAEVIARLGHAHQIVFFNLAAVAAIITFVFQTHANKLFLLFVTPVSSLLGLYWSENYRAILSIGSHIREYEWPFLRTRPGVLGETTLPDWERRWYRMSRPVIVSLVVNASPVVLFAAPVVSTLLLTVLDMQRNALGWTMWSLGCGSAIVVAIVGGLIYRELRPLIHT